MHLLIYAMLRRALRCDSMYSPSSLYVHSSPCASAATTIVIITECLISLLSPQNSLPPVDSYFSKKAENTIAWEKLKIELVGFQRLDGFVRLGTKFGFLLQKREWRGMFPTFILAPSGKAVTGLEEKVFLKVFSTASVEISPGSLELC